MSFLCMIPHADAVGWRPSRASEPRRRASEPRRRASEPRRLMQVTWSKDAPDHFWQKPTLAMQ